MWRTGNRWTVRTTEWIERERETAAEAGKELVGVMKSRNSQV